MITKLAEKWRDLNTLKQPSVGRMLGRHDCADELEAALPVWTRITEDENTLPPKGEMVMLGYPDGGHKSIITIIETKWAASGHYIGKAWRPLCDLDYPPEEKK